MIILLKQIRYLREISGTVQIAFRIGVLVNFNDNGEGEGGCDQREMGPDNGLLEGFHFTFTFLLIHCNQEN